MTSLQEGHGEVSLHLGLTGYGPTSNSPCKVLNEQK